MNLAPFRSVAFIVKGYETSLLNPPPIRVSVSLVLALGCKGFEGLTSSKVKSKDSLSSRVAVNEITGTTLTFFRVISTAGPPGVNGGTGPNTDTISIGSQLCDAETGWQLDTVTARSVAVRRILVTMTHAGLLNICYCTNN
jgi:hypothetical protein